MSQEKLHSAVVLLPQLLPYLLQPLDLSSPPECIVSPLAHHLSSCLAHFQALLGIRRPWGREEVDLGKLFFIWFRVEAIMVMDIYSILWLVEILGV